MGYLTAVSITVGLLAGAWVFFAPSIDIAAFTGFLGWASYFAVGGKKEGAIKAVCCNLSGVLFGVLTILIAGLLPAHLGIIITILAAASMCFQAHIPLLSFIPGTFIGNACYYANGTDWYTTAIGLICGILLGFISDYWAQSLSKTKS